MLSPDKFLDIIKPRESAPAFKLGVIPGAYTTGRPAVTFDGEATTSSRTYPYLSSYTPAANDRVLVAMVGHGGVVLGKVV